MITPIVESDVKDDAWYTYNKHEIEKHNWSIYIENISKPLLILMYDLKLRTTIISKKIKFIKQEKIYDKIYSVTVKTKVEWEFGEIGWKVKVFEWVLIFICWYKL